jgi:hypothetical protein
VSNDLVATLIIIAIPVAALLLVAGALAWGYDAIVRNPIIGVLGITAAAVATGNLFVERSCHDGANRPIVSMFVGDHACHRSGLLSLEVLLLLVVGTSVLVRLGEVKLRR